MYDRNNQNPVDDSLICVLVVHSFPADAAGNAGEACVTCPLSSAVFASLSQHPCASQHTAPTTLDGHYLVDMQHEQLSVKRTHSSSSFTHHPLLHGTPENFDHH